MKGIDWTSNPPSILPPSIIQRLINHPNKGRFAVIAGKLLRLLHQHGHDFFLRVGEVIGVEIPAPVVFPDAALIVRSVLYGHCVLKIIRPPMVDPVERSTSHGLQVCPSSDQPFGTLAKLGIGGSHSGACLPDANYF